MNILVITAIYPEPEKYRLPKDTQVVHYFTKDWISRGHKVIVIHPYFNAVKNLHRLLLPFSYKISQSTIDGVPTIYGEAQIFIPHSLTPSFHQNNKLANRMKMYLNEKFPDFKPDIISVHFPMILKDFVPSFIGETKSLAVFHGTDMRLFLATKDKKSCLNSLNNLFSYFLFRSPKLLHTALDNGFDNFKSGINISGLKNSLIANREFINKKIYTKSDTLRILFAGKLVKQKNIDPILNALALIKNDTRFHFDIIGEGSEYNSLLKKVQQKRLNDKITFYGLLNREKVSEFMSKADVFIMTSKNETLGLVYLEAMAQGCITIGSRNEGIDGIIIDDVNGYLVNPDNSSEIANCLKKISMLDFNKKAMIIKEAYESVADFTEVAMSDSYLLHLKNLIN